MATIPNVCPICGSPYSLDEKGRYVCRFCGHIKPDEATPEETALLYEAAAKLRLADFDGARERYEDIASRFPKCAEAHWGLTLCQYGIKYEDDYDGKKVATCYATSYLSLYGNPDFQKALELADPESRAYYEAQAKVIEDRRKEWVEKARREKPYDIFISYKDSEDGDRTQDSYKAYDLYNELTARGYRVFFSRVSLKDKTGENYEPYIFAALNSATVMLVYASKPEYVKSTWVKNEWNRYLARIKEKEKAPDSLCVVVDGFQPGALPPVLKNKQHLLYGSLTFLQDLLAYVEKQVKAATYKTHRIERKEVALAKKKAKKGIEAVKSEEVSSVKKKTKSLSKEGIQKRAIGASDVTLLTPNQESKLALAEAYLSRGEYEKAKGLYESVLEENPRHPSANFGLLLCSSHVSSLKEWGKSASLQTKREALPMALSVIDAGNGDEAKELLGIYAQACIDACEAADFETGQAIYEGIASYDFGTVRPSFHEDVLATLEDSHEIGFAGIVMPYLSVQPDSFKKHLLILSTIALEKGDYLNAKGFLKLVGDYFGFDDSSYLLSLCAEYQQPNPTVLLDELAKRHDFSSLTGALPLTMPQIEALFAYVAEHALIRLSEGDDIASYVEFLLPYHLPFREGFIQKAIQACMENPCEATSASLKALLPSFDEAHRDSFIAVIRSYALHCKENEAYDLAKEWFDMAIDYAPEERSLYHQRYLAKLGVSGEKLHEAIASTKDYSDIEALLSLRGKDSFYSLLEPYLNACLSAPDLVAVLPVFNNLLAYLPEAEEGQLHTLLSNMGDALLAQSHFTHAKRVYESCVATSPKDHHAYWGMLLCALQCKDEAELLSCQTPISGLPEYENACLAASEDKKALAHYVDVELRQKENIEKEIKRREKEEAKRKAKARRRNRRIIFSSSTIIAAVLATVVAFTVVVPYVNEVREQRRQERIENATTAIDHGDYSAAIQALSSYSDEESKSVVSMANAGLQFKQQNIEEGIGYVVEAGGEANVHYDSGDYPSPKANETIKKKWIDNSASGYDYVWTIDRFTVSVAQRPFTAEVYLKLVHAILITYTIDYDLQEGTAAQPNPTSYTVVSSFTLNQPVRKGYSFEGWYDGAGNRIERIEKGRTGNLSLTAKWKPIAYTITYDLDGGTMSQNNPTSYTIEDTFEFPYAPTKEGYTFEGWYDQNGDHCPGVYRNTGDLQVKAMWWGVDFPIELLSDIPTRGNVSGPEEGQVGTEITVHATPNPGCVFLGWYEGENKVSEEADYTFVMPIGEVSLTAKWDVLHYEISYLLDGGEITEANPTSYTVEDTLPFASPTKNGYEFVRWEDEQGNPYTGIVPGMTGNQTFIAKWKGVLQNLEVSSSDVYGGGTTLVSGTGITGETIKVKAITYGGYTFAGWYQGEEKKSEELIYSFTMPPEAVSLVARFSPNLYDLSVKVDEPTLGSAEIVSGTGYTRESITVKATPNDGVWFAGWYYGPTQKSTEETYTFTMPSYAMQLTAKFIELPEGFVLENEDESMGTARIVGVNKTYPKVVAVEAVAKEGYAFGGWYIGDTFKSYDTTYYITPSGPTTLTATWVPSHGNLVLQVFNPDGGDATIVSGEGKAGDKMVVAAQAKDGYYFAGWADDAHGIISTENTYQFTMPEGVYRLYAGFNVLTDLLTLTSEDENKGTVSLVSGEGYAGEQVTVSATPKDRYFFTGWYAGSTLKSTDPTYTFTMPSSSYSLMARFEAYPEKFNLNSDNENEGTARVVSVSEEDENGIIKVRIEATPKEGYSFAGWYLGTVPQSYSAVFDYEMWKKSEVTLTAKWNPHRGNLTVTRNFERGTAEIVSGNGNPGDTMTVTASANTGYRFKGWVLDNMDYVSYDATYTFVMPSGEHKVDPSFATNEYNLSISSDDENKGTVSGDSGNQFYKSYRTVTATPKTGYVFDGWYDGDNLVSTDATYQFRMPANDLSLVAKWAGVAHTISATSEDSTKGAAAVTSGSGKTGEQITVTATPNPAIRFSGISFYYYDSTKSAAATSFYEGTDCLAFDNEADAKAYFLTKEYGDMQLVTVNESIAALINSGSGSVNYSKASGETTNAHAGQRWVRYKRATWTPSSNENGWALYYYDEGGSGALDPNALSDNLKAAVAAVVDTISAQKTPIYEFTGWYDGSTKVSDDAVYSFTMPAHDYALTAKFTRVSIPSFSVTAEENENKTNVVVQTLGRANSEIASYKVYVNDTVIDDSFYGKKVYLNPGDYRIEITDIYGNQEARELSHQLPEIETSWYYKVDENAYWALGSDHYANLILIDSATDPKTTDVYASTLVEIVLPGKTGMAGLTYSITGLDPTDYYFISGTQAVHVSRFADWEMDVWWNGFPEEKHHYSFHMDTTNQYTKGITCTFQNYDGTLLYNDYVSSGAKATYDGTTPTKPSVDDGAGTITNFEFTGWDKSLKNITADTVFTAQFAETKSFKVTFQNYDGSVLATQVVSSGSTPVYSGSTPTRPEDVDGTNVTTYTFSYWNPYLSAINAPTTYTAQFSSKSFTGYKVMFLDEDNSEIYSYYCEAGKEACCAVAPTFSYDAENVRLFAGWDTDLKNIQSETTAKAVYKIISRQQNGEYPQTRVTDEELIGNLNGLTVTDAQGYYVFGGEKYAKLVATANDRSRGSFNDGTPIIGGQTYWFKVEPIPWRYIYGELEDAAFATTTILDVHLWNESYEGTDENGYYANNWKNSAIRSWLNGEFLDTAWYYDDSLLKVTAVDNSSSTSYASYGYTNPYTCETTYDRVYLLSVQQLSDPNIGLRAWSKYIPESSATTYEIGQMLHAPATDYAIAKGLVYQEQYGPFYFWWLRSPESNKSTCAAAHYGGPGNLVDLSVDNAYYGVRPTVNFNLS